MSSPNAYKCVSGCNRLFQTPEALLDHSRSVHATSKATVPPNTFKCGVPGCGQSFSLYENLTQHGRSHSSTEAAVSVSVSKTFKCSCGRSFSDREALQQHERAMSHSSTMGIAAIPVNNPYKCGMSGCGASFQTHGALLQHGIEMSHLSAKTTKALFGGTGNKKFKCGVHGCGQSYDDHGDLLRHGSTHTPLSPPVITTSQHPLLRPFVQPLQNPSVNSSPFSDGHNPLTAIAELMSNLSLGSQNNTSTTQSSRPVTSQQASSSPISPALSLFRQPENVDARNSAFNAVAGSQIHVENFIVANSHSPADSNRRSDPPPPYQSQ